MFSNFFLTVRKPFSEHSKILVYTLRNLRNLRIYLGDVDLFFYVDLFRKICWNPEKNQNNINWWILDNNCKQLLAIIECVKCWKSFSTLKLQTCEHVWRHLAEFLNSERCPDDAYQNRFSWFCRLESDGAEVWKHVDIVKSFQTSI